MTRQFQDKNGQWVDLEPWGWVVDYNDGSQKHQFDLVTGTYNNFESIGDNVKKITMVNFNTNETHSVDVPKGAKVVHYYDNLIQAPMGGTITRQRSYVFGYEKGKKQQVYTILPNNQLVDGVA